MYMMKQFWLPIQLFYNEVLLYNQMILYFCISFNWQQLKQVCCSMLSLRMYKLLLHIFVTDEAVLNMFQSATTRLSTIYQAYVNKYELQHLQTVRKEFARF